MSARRVPFSAREEDDGFVAPLPPSPPLCLPRETTSASLPSRGEASPHRAINCVCVCVCVCFIGACVFQIPLRGISLCVSFRHERTRFRKPRRLGSLGTCRAADATPLAALTFGLRLCRPSRQLSPLSGTFIRSNPSPLIGFSRE